MVFPAFFSAFFTMHLPLHFRLPLILTTLLLSSPTMTLTTPLAPNSSVALRPASEIIAALNLIPNPEKGYFIESFRDTTNISSPTAASANTTRAASTQIYYLLEGSAGQSVWHRVTDATEVWHFYAGAPLVLSLSHDDGNPPEEKVLGPDVLCEDGQRPQIVIPRGMWQSARSKGDWTLVGCTVAPGFDPSGVELRPDWKPNGA